MFYNEKGELVDGVILDRNCWVKRRGRTPRHCAPVAPFPLCDPLWDPLKILWGSSEGPLQDFSIWDTFFLGSLEDALGDPWKGLGICFWGSLEDSLGDPWKVLSRIFGFGILFWQPSKML